MHYFKPVSWLTKYVQQPIINNHEKQSKYPCVSFKFSWQDINENSPYCTFNWQLFWKSITFDLWKCDFVFDLFRFSLINLLNSFRYQGPVVCNLPCFKDDNDNKATGRPCLSHL